MQLEEYLSQTTHSFGIPLSSIVPFVLMFVNNNDLRFSEVYSVKKHDTEQERGHVIVRSLTSPNSNRSKH